MRTGKSDLKIGLAITYRDGWFRLFDPANGLYLLDLGKHGSPTWGPYHPSSTAGFSTKSNARFAANSKGL